VLRLPGRSARSWRDLAYVLVQKCAHQAVDELRLLLVEPVRLARHALKAKVGHEVLKARECRRSRIGAALGIDDEGGNLNRLVAELRGVVTKAGATIPNR